MRFSSASVGRRCYGPFPLLHCISPSQPRRAVSLLVCTWGGRVSGRRQPWRRPAALTAGPCFPSTSCAPPLFSAGAGWGMLLMDFHEQEMKSVEQQRVEKNRSAPFWVYFAFFPLWRLAWLDFADSRLVLVECIYKSLFSLWHHRFLEGFTPGVFRVSNTSQIFLNNPDSLCSNCTRFTYSLMLRKSICHPLDSGPSFTQDWLLRPCTLRSVEWRSLCGPGVSLWPVCPRPDLGISGGRVDTGLWWGFCIHCVRISTYGDNYPFLDLDGFIRAK